jgi:glycerol-3-phosphate acyltransferase PlsY
MNPLWLAASVVLAYLIGSIPTAYIFGRMLKGIDIREHGSGNMGATNAFRVLGKGPGTLVLVLDILKGFLPVVVLSDSFDLNDPLSLVILSVATVAGHNWTIFLGFKGGKGMATSLGVLIGLCLQLPGLRGVVGGATFIWAVVFLSLGYVSLASIIAAVALPILMVVCNAPFPLIIMSIVLCIFIVFRHQSNIKRLVQGRENRVVLFKNLRRK